ncbi:MAG: ClpXP protease specificity-enhancing factor SspB [Magnetococcus sp. YQC-9]
MDIANDAEKADVIRFLLETEGRVMLCLDATWPGVAVPRRFASDSGLRLILNRTMPQPIHIGPEAIESELRFGGIPHYCVVPYDALWGAFNPDTRHGMFWSDSMPEEIRARHAMEESMVRLPEGAMERFLESETPDTPPPARNERVTLRVIEGDGAAASGTPSKRPRPNLRVVS